MRQKFKKHAEVMRQKRHEIYNVRDSIRLNNDIREIANTLPDDDDLSVWAEKLHFQYFPVFGFGIVNPIKSLHKD